MRDYRMRTGREMKRLIPTRARACPFAGYTILSNTPTIIALTNDGSVYTSWRGQHFPTISEVAAVANN